MVRLRRLSFVALIAGALVLAGCTGGTKQAAPATTDVHVPVSAGRSATLRMTNGLNVKVPAGAASGSGTLAGSVTQAPAPAPKDMSIAGPVYRLEVTGARLTGHVRLTIPVPHLATVGTSGPDAAMLAYYDAKSRAWIPVPATYNPAQHTLTALSPHLSIWTALRVDTGKLLDGASDLLKGFLDISDTTGQPSCPGQADLATAGVTAVSDKGNLVKWCAGVDAGQPLLHVADNRHYALEADHPADWQASHIGNADSLTEKITDYVARELSPAGNGRMSAIIPGGESEQFALPPGSAGQVNVQPSTEAYLINALLYGASTLSMVMDRLPGAPAPKLTKTQEAIKQALDDRECAAEADHLLEDKVTSAATAGHVFRDDVDWAVGCMGKEWKTAYGLSGWIGQFVVSVVLWLADGIRLVVDGAKAAIDSVIYWRSYRIAVSSPEGATCSAQALAHAAHAYMVAQGRTDTREIDAHACTQEYAEILFDGSAGTALDYQATLAFKAVSGQWHVIGDSDYIPPGSFGMPVSVGQALNKTLQASSGGNEGVSF